MLLPKTNIIELAAACMIFIVGCNENTSSNASNEINTVSVAPKTEPAAMPNYDPSMDPYIQGGDGLKKFGDTLGLKMYEFSVSPGESWGLHTHPDHIVYVLEGGTMALYMKEAGRIDTLTFPTGMALISGPLTDSGRNVGKTTIKMVVADIHRPRQQ